VTAKGHLKNRGVVMQNMNQEDLNWCLKRVPENLKRILMDHAQKLCIGGGFIRSCITGDKANDIDIFSNSKDTAEILSTQLSKQFGYKKIDTHNAITLLRHGLPFQFIHRWVYDHPGRNVLSDFDFTICCASIWYEDSRWHGLVHDVFYQDLAAKRLRYTYPNRIEEAGGSALRVLKYYQKGYRITLQSYAGVIARLGSGVSEVKSAVDEEKLGKVLTGLLVEVDPNAVCEDKETFLEEV
jgi:hypothetical protein